MKIKLEKNQVVTVLEIDPFNVRNDPLFEPIIFIRCFHVFGKYAPQHPVVTVNRTPRMDLNDIYQFTAAMDLATTICKKSATASDLEAFNASLERIDRRTTH